MTLELDIARIALFGLPGAGKSTAARLLQCLLSEAGYKVSIVKLAAPLYDVQDQFYRRLGNPLEPGQQDGSILNFLGSHFRLASPGFLVEDFAFRCRLSTIMGADVILCDDARPADLPSLASQGFRLVRVAASDALRSERKTARGDRVLGRDDHPTELGGEQMFADIELDNSGTLGDLDRNVRELAHSVLQGPSSGPDRAQAVRAGVADLVNCAEKVIRERYIENRHQIGAILVNSDGRLFAGVHVEAMVGRASICAEAMALGAACAASATDLRLVVAVRYPKPTESGEPRLVPPCGLCREVLLDYGPSLRAVIGSREAPDLVPLTAMLPNKYQGTKWMQPAESGGFTL